MNIPHVDLVKDAIGSQAVEALRAIFESCKGNPPSTPVQRFRADHIELLDVLNTLENKYCLIERTADCKDYLIRPYALPLIGNPDSESILNLMDKIYRRFPDLYKEHLTHPIGVDVLCGSNLDNIDQVNEALYYLTKSHGIYSGMTTGFPYSEEGTLCIAESVLTKKSIGDVLSEYYEWHFVNPKNQIASFEFFDSPNTQKKSIFFKQNTNSAKPDWYEFLNDNQKALIWEIDIAIINQLEALPTIGLRTLLETVMVEKIGDSGNFPDKVRRFTEGGYVTHKMAEALSHVLDAGNASAHRAYFPNQEDLMTCVELVKHLIHGVYILKPRVEKVAKNTPKRGKT